MVDGLSEAEKDADGELVYGVPESRGGVFGARGDLLSQGAEARVFKVEFLGRPAVVKERFEKKYRHPVLDAKLTKSRCNGEARSMLKARKLGVLTPAIYAMDHTSYSIVSEFVEGLSMKDFLLSADAMADRERIEAVASQAGRAIARLHDGGLVHGDLTTSNMILRSSDGNLVMIDFGLSFNSVLAEDKAVDLYVMERALLSMHSALGDVFELVLSTYKKHSKQWSATLNRFAEVRMRGRKRVMVG